MNIEDIFDSIIYRVSSKEEAMELFKQELEANQDMKALYEEWCFEMGCKLKNGFKAYYNIVCLIIMKSFTIF